jgi:hypothetical protein
MDLQEALLNERHAAYARLRGGFPIPLAGTIYWGVLGILGYSLDLFTWSMIAFIGTGAIFPLAILLARLFKNDFMKDKTAVTGVLIPAFISMLLFWPMLIGARLEAPELMVLILAIGLSLHWPVIGWSYGKTGLYSAHSIIRAVVVLLIWYLLPEARLTLLPLSVAAIYLVTVVAIYVDSGQMKKKLS